MDKKDNREIEEIEEFEELEKLESPVDIHKYIIGGLLILLNVFMLKYEVLDASSFKQLFMLGIPYSLALILYGFTYFKKLMYKGLGLFVVLMSIYIISIL